MKPHHLVLLILACLLFSCKDRTAISSLVLQPAKQMGYNIYSGKQTLQSSLPQSQKAPKATLAFSYHKIWDGDFPNEYKSLIPPAVTNEEKQYVLNYIKNHPDEGTDEFGSTTYFVQNIGSSYAYYTGNTLVDHNGASHGVTGGNHMDYLQINGNHINDYNSSWGPDALCRDLPLINPTYHDSWGDKDQTKTNAFCFYYINGYGCYLCFDYRTAKNSGEYYNGDGVYNDWVIKLTPADGYTHTPATEPVTTTPMNGEVEINLSLNAEKEEGDYIASKLSVHIRDTSDLVIFLPVPMEYYLEKDDMQIVLSHQSEQMQYNIFVETVDMDIAGQRVSMNVGFEEGGIRISINNIQPEVLRYCREQYADGLTFEIWTYYHDGNRTLLQDYLNQSTVSFTGNIGNYINAFGIVDGETNPLDCTVTRSE